MKYLAANNSTKTIKTGKRTEYLQAIMYLIPDDEICPMSKLAGCQEACLVSAGRGKFNNVRAARQKKQGGAHKHSGEPAILFFLFGVKRHPKIVASSAAMSPCV